MVTDETRLDLHAADPERLEQWRTAYRESRRTLDSVMRQGAALYPIVGRSGGRLYGTPRLPPPSEVIEAREDQDEEIKMTDSGRVERPTYEEALEQAIAYARNIPKVPFYGESQRDYAEAYATASRAWSALAGLLRTDQLRADTAAYVERLSEMSFSPTGRKSDYIRTPSPEAQRLIAEAAQTELKKDDV